MSDQGQAGAAAPDVELLTKLEQLRPEVHRHLSPVESYRILAELFRDVQESHSLLSVRGRVLGNRLPERIRLLCERAEAGEKARQSLETVRAALRT